MKTYNIGRNSTSEINLQDALVSRQHAQLIVSDNGQVIIKDLGSSNGTFVNGNRISEYRLKAGDIVKCGNVFLDWNLYIEKLSAGAAPVTKEETSSVLDLNYSDIANNINKDKSITTVLKYLTTKIFDIGDLFKPGLNLLPSILFFLITPVVITFFMYLYFYLKTPDINFLIQNNFLYMVILPTIVTVFLYGVSQFITISILSIKNETNLGKIAFTSSLISFLQFTIMFIFSSGVGISLLFNNDNSFNLDSFFNPFSLVYFTTIAIPVMLSIGLTLIIFIYNYFKIIGYKSGIAIHLTILTFFLNLSLSMLFSYIFVLIAMKL